MSENCQSETKRSIRTKPWKPERRRPPRARRLAPHDPYWRRKLGLSKIRETDESIIHF